VSRPDPLGRDAPQVVTHAQGELRTLLGRHRPVQADLVVVGLLARVARGHSAMVAPEGRRALDTLPSPVNCWLDDPVPDLDPHDDYPDSADLLTTEQIQSGILPLNFKQALAAPTEAFRAWAAGSPCRSLHPAGDVLMVARLEAVRPREVRAPSAGEEGLWLLRAETIREGVHSVVAQLPHGVSVRRVAIGNDDSVMLGLDVAVALAGPLGVPPHFDVTTSLATVGALARARVRLRERVTADDLFAWLLAESGVKGTELARRAELVKEADAALAAANEAERKRPKPPVSEYRKLVKGLLAKIRPALIRDLQTRVFPYEFPPGTRELGFEMMWDDLEPLPIVGYMMDGNDGQVMIELPSGQRTLSGTLEILPGHSFVPAGPLAAFRGVDYTLSSVHVPMVLRWFVEGWKAAGGAKLFPLLANISYHDGGGMTKLPSAAGRRQPAARTTRTGARDKSTRRR
jgi:hypothetical protein